jgi:hypothetical protein
MKTLFISIIVICSAVSCITQRKQNISGEVIGLEKYNSKTITLVDFLNRDKIPNVLKLYYYNNLEEQDFYTPQSIISKNDSTRTIHLKSKQAKEGYMFINKYSNDFVSNNENIIYVIGQDTINSKEEVMKLIEMKRTEVVKVDTVKVEAHSLIIINH